MIIKFTEYIKEELKNPFKSLTLEELNNKLNIQYERYELLLKDAKITSIYELKKLSNLIFKISFIIYDMFNLIKKEYQQYNTKNDIYIHNLLIKCRLILNDYNNNFTPDKMPSKYKKGIELIEILEDGLKHREE